MSLRLCTLWLASATLCACLTPIGGVQSAADVVIVEVDPDAAPTDDAEASPGPEPTLRRFGTLNVLRFFDTTCDSGTCGGSAYEPSVSQDQFDGKARALTHAIEAMDVHFLMLQEVESAACMQALQERLGDRYTVAYLAETGTPASADVGVLAEGQLIDVVLHRQDPILRADGTTTTFAREFPEVHLTHHGQDIVLMPLHFRSKYNDDPARRLAEAEAAQRIATEVAAAHPDAIVVLGGDVNDGIGSPALLALEAGGLLDGVYDDLAAHKRWTYDYNSQHMMLDHLLLARDATGAWVAGETRVIREDIVGNWPSDHAGLIATIHAQSTPNVRR
jgi:hypothetical protein